MKKLLFIFVLLSSAKLLGECSDNRCACSGKAKPKKQKPQKTKQAKKLANASESEDSRCACSGKVKPKKPKKTPKTAPSGQEVQKSSGLAESESEDSRCACSGKVKPKKQKPQKTKVAEQNSEEESLASEESESYGCSNSDAEQAADNDADQIKEAVKEAYSIVAQESCGGCQVGGCCGGNTNFSQYLGYSSEEMQSLAHANLGLGCGNPIMLGDIPLGATVVDLGSGAGFDCFLAAKKVGQGGKVIGIDLTEAMIKKAQQNAKEYGFDNVEFILGDIEKIPVDSDSVDIVISNCVINLSLDKSKVFSESYRILRSGGKMYVADVVLLKELSDEQLNDAKLYCACVSGALMKDVYIKKLEEVGFVVTVVAEDTAIGQTWFNNSELPIASLKYIAVKQ